MSERHPPVIDQRTYQRRRLAVLAGLLAVVLGVAPFVGSAGEGAGAVEVAAGGEVIRAASVGSPTAVRELLSETTTTLVEATGATTAVVHLVPAPGEASTTTTTEAPATTTTAADDVDPAPEADEVAAEAEADEPEPAATRQTTTTRPPAPSTTAAPPTTAAPAPTTTTTAPPAREQSSGDAYDDPRSTQVWYDLAQCESGGRWSIDTGNGYYGGLQFSLGAWESVGGTGYPHEHPAGTQIEMGRKLQARQGWGAWPHCSEKLGLR